MRRPAPRSARSGSEQRRFAQSALGKYLPRDIAAQILRDPKKLSLTGEKRAIYTLFTDIEGFTELSHGFRRSGSRPCSTPISTG